MTYPRELEAYGIVDRQRRDVPSRIQQERVGRILICPKKTERSGLLLSWG